MQNEQMLSQQSNNAIVHHSPFEDDIQHFFEDEERSKNVQLHIWIFLKIFFLTSVYEQIRWNWGYLVWSKLFVCNF